MFRNLNKSDIANTVILNSNFGDEIFGICKCFVFTVVDAFVFIVFCWCASRVASSALLLY